VGCDHVTFTCSRLNGLQGFADEAMKFLFDDDLHRPGSFSGTFIDAHHCRSPRADGRRVRATCRHFHIVEVFELAVAIAGISTRFHRRSGERSIAGGACAFASDSEQIEFLSRSIAVRGVFSPNLPSGDRHLSRSTDRSNPEARGRELRSASQPWRGAARLAGENLWMGLAPMCALVGRQSVSH